MDEKTYTIMVLNDGETYSDLNGCSIYTVTEEGMDKLGEGEKLSQLDQKDILLNLPLLGECNIPYDACVACGKTFKWNSDKA